MQAWPRPAFAPTSPRMRPPRETQERGYNRLVEAPDRIRGRSACDSPLPHRKKTCTNDDVNMQAGTARMVAAGKTGGADNLSAMIGGDSSRHQCPQCTRDRIVTRIRLRTIHQQGCGFFIADCGQRSERATHVLSLRLVGEELLVGLPSVTRRQHGGGCFTDRSRLSRAAACHPPE